MQNLGAISDVFRAERSRVLATTIRVTHGDFDLAEEAVQDAFEAALARWPHEGTPAEPRGWLVQVARHKAIDAIRRRVKLRELVAAADELDELDAAAPEPVAVPDDLLRLMFTCCHPALAREAQVALTLRTLAGLSTEEIARAFVTSTEAMAQRIVRAKSKIAVARIPYEVPEVSQLAERTDAVMAVIYLVFNEGYAATAGDTWIRRDLCGEAIRLARLLVELAPSPQPPVLGGGPDPYEALPASAPARRSTAWGNAFPQAEAHGLLALMLLHDARRDARTDADGDVVLLEDQDRARWDRAAIAEALALVPRALLGGGGPYGIQAAIAALHAQAARAEDTDWPQIAALFDELHRRQPSAIVALNRAVAVAMWRGPEAGLAAVEPLRAELDGYHLLHAARADLLRRLGRATDAAAAYRAALERVGSEPERRFLQRRLAALTS